MAVSRLAAIRLGRMTQGRRFFRLLHTVGLVWIGASTQAEAVDRFGLVGPWELTLVFYQTDNSYLAGFGIGWARSASRWWVGSPGATGAPYHDSAGAGCLPGIRE